MAPAPWRNGAGATRELASHTDVGGELLWRISLASLEDDAPFSAFPGLDRLFVALAPLRLVVAGEGHALAAGQQLRFPGEATVRVLVAAPAQALNVMTRRGTVRSHVLLRDAGEPAAATAEATVLLGTCEADVLLKLSGVEHAR